MNNNYTQKVIQTIQSTVNKVGMNVEVIQQETGVNMMYDFIEHCLLVDVQRLRVAREEMENPIELTEYVTALTLHELGHALDRKALLASLPQTREIIELKRSHSWEELSRNMHYMKMLVDENDRDYVFEQTAWEHAARMNDVYKLVNPEQLEDMKHHGLFTYEEAFLLDRTVYEGLAAAETTTND